jgi:outer membrane lipoprotein-sorting protein
MLKFIKQFKLLVRATSMVVSILMFLITSAGAAEVVDKSQEIIAAIQKNLAPSNIKATYQFTNHRLDKTVMNYEVNFLIKDVNHSHGYFIKPEREKGREVLRQQEVLWTYIPSVGKAVRIADRDSFAGGDFSNADVLRVDWLNQYDSKMAKETPNQFIIDLAAKAKEAAYSKMRLWVDKKTLQPVQQYFYDAKGTLLKKCLYGAVKNFAAITRPSRMLMENVITTQKSEMQIIDIQTGQTIPDIRFTVDNLGKTI